ncbi:MAG TPA: GGDEF domain-containing protein [Elusimicrobiota bacterium]|nr:GGDEF domain-containing protein [Elusimicrobiota bacterium]
MRLSIKAKIFLASAITLFMMVGLIGFVLNAQNTLAELMNAMIQKNMAAMRVAEQIKYNFVLYDNLLFRYLFTNDKTLLVERERAREKVHGAVRLMRNTAPGSTEKELLGEIEEEIARYDQDVARLLDTYSFSTDEQKKGVVQLIKAIEAGEAPPSVRQTQKQTLALLSAEGRARLTRIYSQSEKLVDISRAKLEEAQGRVQASVDETERTAVFAGAAAALGALAVAVLLAVSLLTPLKNLLAGVKKVTAGRLDTELPVEGADEIGGLTREFNTMTRHLREKQERLLTETITDSLTGLHNFRYFQVQLKEEISRAARYKSGFALLIVDIDHFKHYNDTNGHQMGNEILKQVAATLKDTLRPEDFIARYGGEEFVVLLPETGRNNAAVAAQRLREAVEQAEFAGGQTQPLGRVTISLGGAVYPSDAAAAARLVEKADRALYAAKKAGRNRAVWADEASAADAKA